MRLSCLLLLWFPIVAAAALPRLEWRARTLEHESFRAQDLHVDIDQGRLHLSIGRAEAAGHTVQALQLQCTDWQMGRGVHCERGRYSLRLPGWGPLSGAVRFRYRSERDAWAELQSEDFGRLRIETEGAAVTLRLETGPVDAALLARLAAWLGQPLPLVPEGLAELQATATLRGADWTARFHGTLSDWTLADEAGLYASERLGLHFEGEANHAGGPLRWQLRVHSDQGQVYVEPVFLDLAQTPMTLDLEARQRPQGWQLQGLARHGVAVRLAFEATLGERGEPRQTDIRLSADDLAPAMRSFVQPFLIGTPLEDLQLGGSGEAQLTLRGLVPEQLSARLQAVSMDGQRLGLSLRGLSGELHWHNERDAAPSALRWQGGSAQKIPFGAAELHLAASPRGARLLQPFRLPLLDGTLRLNRLSLRRLTSAQPQAELDAAVEAIDLAALSRALGWPEFEGRLDGRLPGLTVDGDIWTVAGSLEADVFGGRVSISELRAVDPFGVVPSVDARLRWRRIDLAQLTQAFSFGRIEGRLDGDVDPLRLLGWRPVAMDAHFYSSPGGGYPRRISQRAIDHISAIGGGPSGMLSRGALSAFEDFAYADIAWRCRLELGVCTMGGGRDARNGGFYIVRGRLLPRIDVIGHHRRVDWHRLLQQIEAVLAAEAPVTDR